MRKRDLDRAPALAAYLEWITGRIQPEHPDDPVEHFSQPYPEIWESVLSIGDSGQRSRWRRALASPSPSQRVKLHEATKGTHRPIPLTGWPGDPGCMRRKVAPKRAA